MRTFSLLLTLIACAPMAALRAQDSPLALSCTVCHGDAGRASAVPDFRARSAPQIEAALRAYREGTLAGTAMPRLAKSLSDAEIEALAQQFGATP